MWCRAHVTSQLKARGSWLLRVLARPGVPRGTYLVNLAAFPAGGKLQEGITGGVRQQRAQNVVHGHVRHHTQLHLAVVRRQHHVTLPRDERRPAAQQRIEVSDEDRRILMPAWRAAEYCSQSRRQATMKATLACSRGLRPEPRTDGDARHSLNDFFCRVPLQPYPRPRVADLMRSWICAAQKAPRWL